MIAGETTLDDGSRILRGSEFLFVEDADKRSE